MIDILIVWFIAGILLLVLPGLMYNANTIDMSSFIIVIIVGIPILLASIYLISKRNKLDANEFIRNLEGMFIISAVISLIIFLVGAVGFFFENLLNLEPQTTNTMLAFGILFILSIISWIYVERSKHNMASIQVIKAGKAIKDIERNMKNLDDEMTTNVKVHEKCVEDSNKMGELNKEELSKRRN